MNPDCAEKSMEGYEWGPEADTVMPDSEEACELEGKEF